MCYMRFVCLLASTLTAAAVLMSVAAVIMAEDLPIEMTLRIGCVENSVSGSAMRPLDVLRTRSGKTVEVGNTEDALLRTFPTLPFVWPEIAMGGGGVFLLRARDLIVHLKDKG